MPQPSTTTFYDRIKVDHRFARNGFQDRADSDQAKAEGQCKTSYTLHRLHMLQL